MIEYTYRAPPEELPAPLPTLAEIQASTHIPRRFNDAQIFFVRPHFVVKCGRSVRLAEGDNMRFVRKHSDLIVPTLYASFRDTVSRKNYLIMEYIPGDSASMVWAKLGKATKDSMAAELRKGFDQLRSVPSPGYMGGINGEPPKLLFQQPEGSGPPPKSGYDWVETMVKAAQEQYPMRPGHYEWTRGMYHTQLDSSSDASQAVFTHGDLHAENVVLREGDLKPVVIDWERSGFYPPYYEFLIAMCEEHWVTDWGHYVCTFLDQHQHEMFCLFHYRAWSIFGRFTLPPNYEPDPPSQYVMNYWLNHLDKGDNFADSDSN